MLEYGTVKTREWMKIAAFGETDDDLLEDMTLHHLNRGRNVQQRGLANQRLDF